MHVPNQQRTLTKLFPELRCRNFVTKRRLSMQIVAKHTKKKPCVQHEHVLTELPFCMPPLLVGFASLLLQRRMLHRGPGIASYFSFLTMFSSTWKVLFFQTCSGVFSLPPNQQRWYAKMKAQSEYVYVAYKFFARLAPVRMLSRCLSTQFSHRSSGGSLLRVRCRLGFLSPTGELLVPSTQESWRTMTWQLCPA